MTDLEALAASLAAFGHPTRLRIALCLRDGEDSPKRVADRLGVNGLGPVSHHFRMLARAGMIRQTRTRPARGAVEHFYVLTEQSRDLLAALGI